MKSLSACLAGLAVASLATAAGAASVNSSNCGPLDGTVTVCVADGATVTAAGDPLIRVDFRGNDAIGVGRASDGDREKEIGGGSGESLTVLFDVLQSIDRIVLGAFYNPQEFRGDPEEIAVITAFDGLGGSQVLRIRNSDNSLSGLSLLPGSTGSVGSITRSGPSDIADGRVTLSDVFQGFAVRSLVFTAADTPKGADNSDYALESVSATPVPLPAAALLLAGGLGALGALRRRA